MRACHRLEEMCSVGELRAIVKTKFAAYKEVKDPRVRLLLSVYVCTNACWV